MAWSSLLAACAKGEASTECKILGFRVKALGFRVKGLGLEIQGAGFGFGSLLRMHLKFFFVLKNHKEYPVMGFNFHREWNQQ